ncbi:hypothetical protein EDD90_2730 [Streptomyces sp. Ag109_O5-1]|nr:hypothetical protein [Streptomyces sp. Ag109_O5-1]RPE39713.1 hypothetical protein EDD90_2730 [Streptomyces sp. Ag109_O5-1]
MRLGVRVGPFWASGSTRGRRKKWGPVSWIAFLALVGYLIATNH